MNEYSFQHWSFQKTIPTNNISNENEIIVTSNCFKSLKGRFNWIGSISMNEINCEVS